MKAQTLSNVLLLLTLHTCNEYVIKLQVWVGVYCILVIHVIPALFLTQLIRREGFQSLRTNKYKLHFYETPSGLKFVLNTDLGVGNIHSYLQQMYSKVCIKCIFLFQNDLAFSIHISTSI